MDMQDFPAAPSAPEGMDSSAPSAPDKPKAPSIYELVAEHVKGEAKSDHSLVHEHAAEAQLESWQLAALCARFHAHGVHRNARMSKDVFKAALHEALHGRI
jgi:hypothetical protein